MAKLSFNVTIHEEQDGSYWAEVKELPGCFASGFSMDELREALAEAIRLWLPDGIEFDHLQWGAPRRSGKTRATKKPPKKVLVCA